MMNDTVLLLDYPALLIGIAFVFGLAIGSFLNVVIYRLPVMMHRAWTVDALDHLQDDGIVERFGLDRISGFAEGVSSAHQHVAQTPKLTLSRPRSRCGACGHAIGPLENIPVASWLWLRGRCSACKTRISARYPLIEALTGILFALAAYQFGPTPYLLLSFVLIALLVAMTFIDADTMLLPDTLTLPLLWIGILASALNLSPISLAQSITGAVAGYGAFWLIGTLFKLLRGMEGMGRGDYKLLAALGAWFGWTALLPIVLMSAGVGSVVGLTLMATKRASLLSRLPFGVYLAPAGLLMLFFGRAIVDWLLSAY